MIEELAALLGAAVGCSRAVTSAGWRPHTDQVGQTGTKISPSLYIACGISGATQHMAGLQGREEAAGDQPGQRSVDLRERRLRGDRRSPRGRPGDLGRDQEGEGRIASLVSALALAAALAVSGTLFVTRVRLLAGLVQNAAPTQRSGDVPRRARNEAEIVLGQRKLLQRLGPGLMHAFIFWGFLVLAPTILIALIGIVDKHSTLPWLGHQGWYALLVDISCVLVLGGVIAALWIRKVQKTEAVRGQPSRRGRPDPGPDRDDRDQPAALARDPDRAAPERVAGVVVSGLQRPLAPVRRQPDDQRARARVRLDPRPDDPDASWPTSPAPSTSTSSSPRSTSGSGARAPAGGSSH